MDKKITKVLLSSVVIGIALSLQSVEACSAFIIGKGLTKDGTTLYGRTEDYPYKQGDGTTAGQHTHNKNFIVNPAKDYNEGDMLEDLSTGFKYPHLRHEFKYTSVSDDSRDTDEGIFDEHGFNEFGVSLTATLTATPREDVLKVDPLVKNGIAEAAMTTLVLPRAHTAREAVEILAKVIDEKGSAEGNNIMFADKDELWYMEIYSGHQYVAYKYPDDKFSVMPNTYFLGTVDLSDKENVISSKDILKVAHQAGSYREVNGKFHLAASYAPKLAERNRSRQYAGIKLLNPQSSVKYDDEYYEFLQDTPRRDYTVEDAIKVQRNRFETLEEGFIPDDEVPGYKYDTDYTPTDNIAALPEAEQAKYKYAPGNENVVDPHIYQIDSRLPRQLGGTMWLGLSRSRNTPYVPYFGSIKDTFEAYKVRGGKYSPDSWYWVADHIDKMVTEHKDLFGKTIKSNWEEVEKLLIAYQEKWVAEYTGKTDVYVREHADEYTEKSIKVAETVFNLMKDAEAKMEKAIATKTPLASPFIDVTPLKEVLNRVQPGGPTSEEPTTQDPTITEPTVEVPTIAQPTVETPATKVGFDGDNYYNENGQQVFDKWVFDKQYDSWFFIKADGTYARNEWIGDYYLKNGGYMAKSEWIYDNNYQSWYYLNKDGSYAHSQWVLYNGSWYYLHADGKMATGWVLYNGAWYYLNDTGSMKSSQWFELNGKWYYVNESGALLVNTVTPDGYRVNANGEWV